MRSQRTHLVRSETSLGSSESSSRGRLCNALGQSSFTCRRLVTLQLRRVEVVLVARGEIKSM